MNLNAIYTFITFCTEWIFVSYVYVIYTVERYVSLTALTSLAKQVLLMMLSMWVLKE